MAASHCIALGAEIFSEFRFHLDSGVEGHRIKTFVKLRKQFNAVTFHDRGSFEPGFVIGKAFFRRKASHSDVNAGLVGVVVGIFAPNTRELGSALVEQHHVHTMVECR